MGGASELLHEPLPHTFSTNSNSEDSVCTLTKNRNKGRLAVREGGREGERRERRTTNKQGLRERPDIGREGEA